MNAVRESNRFRNLLSVGSLTIALLALNGVAAHAGPATPLPTDLSSVSKLRAYIAKERETIKERQKAGKGHDSDAKKSGGKDADEEKDEESERLDHLESWLARAAIRAYPGDRINSAAYLKAMKQRDLLPAARIFTAAVSQSGDQRTASAAGAAPSTFASLTGTNLKWEFTGPKNTQPSNRGGLGPGAIVGRVNCAAFDPKVPTTIYIATPAGGVWKSIDAGKNWFPLGDQFPVTSSSSVVVSPKDSQVVLASLGDYDGGDFFGDVPGIMRSTDGGRNWTVVGDVMKGHSAVSMIAFDPDNPNIVVASSGGGEYRYGAGGGLYYSLDAGATWASATVQNAGAKPDFRNVKIGVKDTVTGKRPYFAASQAQGAGSFPKGIYRSDDQGKTWSFFDCPLLGTPSGFAVAPSAVDPKTVYVASENDKKVSKGVLAADGKSYVWTDISGALATDSFWGQGFYDFYLTTVPLVVGGTPGEMLYFGRLGINSSVNGGSTWTDVTNTYSGKDEVHTDQHSLTFYPGDPTRMLSGNDGGIYGMNYDSAKGTHTFVTDLNKTLGNTQLYTADWSPTNSRLMITAAQDNSNPAALNYLDTWLQTGAGDGMNALINPTRQDIMYVSSQFQGITRSTVGLRGNVRDYIVPAVYPDLKPLWDQEVHPFVGKTAMDSTYPHPLYLGTNYMWRWNEPSQSWDARVGGVEFADGTKGGYVLAMAVAPSDPKRIYVGTSDARFWMSKDKGATWTKLSDGKADSSKLPNRAITGFSINPTKPDDVLVTLSGTGVAQVFRVTAAGTSPVFTALAGSGTTGKLPDISANCIERNPVRPDTDFFVGTDLGLFYTSDGGTNWQNATAPLGLPNTEVTAIKATPRTGFLNLSTFGRGLWRLSIGKLLAQQTAN